MHTLGLIKLNAWDQIYEATSEHSEIASSSYLINPCVCLSSITTVKTLQDQSVIFYISLCVSLSLCDVSSKLEKFGYTYDQPNANTSSSQHNR